MRLLSKFAIGVVTALAGFAAFMVFSHLLVADALRPGKPDTVWLGKMTWAEVRQAVKEGHDTVILPFGGTEQGGLHLVLGKHNHIIAAATERAAKKLGNVLVAPVMPYAPEGNFSPPSGNMPWAGTMGLKAKTFTAVAEDLAQSLKVHGFKRIIFVADHGLSIEPLDKLAKRLDQAWKTEGVWVHHIASYYLKNGQVAWLRQQGFADNQIGNHAGIRDTSELMAVLPDGVRDDRLHAPALKFGENIGTSGDPALASTKIGQKMLELKVQALVAAIRALQN